MKLTTKTRYSLRILLQLASNYNGKPVKGKDIATIQNITEPYLEQIMISLKSACLVKTVRGCYGGYELNLPPEKISVLDIIEIFEGKIEFADCLENRFECSGRSKCFAADVWKQLADSFKSEAKIFTLQYILDNSKQSNILEYVI